MTPADLLDLDRAIWALNMCNHVPQMHARDQGTCIPCLVYAIELIQKARGPDDSDWRDEVHTALVQEVEAATARKREEFEKLDRSLAAGLERLLAKRRAAQS